MALVVQYKRTRNPLQRIQLTRSIKGRVALTAIVSPTLPPVEQEGGPSDEVEDSDEEASEEEWEDIGEGDDGGSGPGREDVS